MGTTEAILLFLKEGKRVSGEVIATKIDVSRTAVWKSINGLRKQGYGIVGDAKGYLLNKVPDLLLPYEITPLLKTKDLGRYIEHHKKISTTNERARELAETGRPEGTLVISEVQDRGKGRLGRRWISPKGGIWMSLILRPGLHPSVSSVLTLAGGVAVAKTLADLGFEATLKWPNDVLIEAKKVCGLLTEMSGDMDRVNYMIMGFGINANFPVSKIPKTIRSQATTLQDIRGATVDRASIVAEIMARFEKMYKAGPSTIIGQWRRLTSTLGQRVRVTTSGEKIEGDAVDISPTGALIVKLGDGKKRSVYSGDCQHLRTG